jgi:competence protein CoiA
MQFALVDRQRHLPTPKMTGRCPVCGDGALAKCGSKVIWHWAHAGRRHCDPWWQNETLWHRCWKSYFPEPWREVVHVDDETGEKHIADVKTAGGLVVEFQNSPMLPAEFGRAKHSTGK